MLEQIFSFYIPSICFVLGILVYLSSFQYDEYNNKKFDRKLLAAALVFSYISIGAFALFLIFCSLSKISDKILKRLGV